MDTFELIRQTGLSKKESAVYASLLDVGQQSLSDLHRNTQINRPALYEVLPRLKHKELVSQVKVKNRFQYVAESPKRLLAQYSKQVEADIKGLSELTETFASQDSSRPSVKYFEGNKGMEFVFDDVIYTLPVGGEFYRYSSRQDVRTKRFENTYYAKNRDKRKLERLVITSSSKAKGKAPKLERAAKAIPENFDLFEDNISLLIYGPKTAYIDYSSKTSFIIESEKIARFQHKLFRLLWKQLP
jgi:sugar-specific transcriptional regulator TrmB